MDYKWVALLAISAGTFVVSFNLSMIFTAVPEIMKDFAASVSSVSWIGIAYALSFAGFQPIMGSLADMRGKKKLFSLGLIVFTFGSGLSAISWDLLSMSIARFIQGVGAAAVFPTGMAILGDLFPREERGKALGIWGIAGSAGPGIGITFGGFVFDLFGGSWRAIYWVSVALGLLSLFVALYLLKPSAALQGRRADIPGSLLFMSCMAFLIFLINRLGNMDGTFLLLLAGFVASLFLFAKAETKKGEDAMVDVSLARNRFFLTIGATAFLSFVALQGSVFLLPFFLENIQRLSATTAGLLVTPLFVTLALGSLFGGKLSDVMGTKKPAILGGLVSAIGLFLFSLLDAKTPFWFVAAASAFVGLGIGTVLPPLGRAIIVSAAPEKRGSASGIFNTVRNLGGPFGVAILPVALEARISYHTALGLQAGIAEKIARYQGAVQGFSDTFLFAAVICALGVLTAALIPKAKQQERFAGG